MDVALSWRRSLIGLSLLLGLPFLGPGSRAQTTAPVPQNSRRFIVCTKPVRPFVIVQGNELSGYSIDLWKQIAQELNLSFDFKLVDNVPQVLESVEKKEADAAIAALSITAERESRIDFSHPFYESGLQILSRTESRSGLGSIAHLILNANLLFVVGVLIGLLLLNAHILWFFERRRNEESFPSNYVVGVTEAAWWSICTLITGGCENKSPVGIAGRLVAIIWMLTGIGLVSYFTAVITTTMTVSSLAGEIKGLSDLKGKTVATVKDSTAMKFLNDQGLSVDAQPDIDSAVKALVDGKVQAVVYDAPVLQYLLKEQPDAELTLVPGLFDRQTYGIGLPSGSSHRKEINRVLLKLTERGYFDDLNKKWFGEQTP